MPHLQICQITRCQTDAVRNTQNTHKPTYRYTVFYYNYADYSVEMFSAELNKRNHLFVNLICLGLVGRGKASTSSSNSPRRYNTLLWHARNSRLRVHFSRRYNKMCIRPLNLLWTSYNMSWERNSLHARKLSAFKTSQSIAILIKCADWYTKA